MRGFFTSTFTSTPVLHNVLLDQSVSRAHYPLMHSTTKTTKRIAAMTKQLTAMRAVGLTYDLPEVQAVLASINALCSTEVGQ